VRGPAARAEFRDVRYTAFFIARRPPPEIGRRFVTSYAATYGVTPSHQAALAYDAALLLGRAPPASSAARSATTSPGSGRRARRSPARRA